ncbi:MAG TPA: Gfo/Idh/MocA family oxidoreductase [Halococcus sp.]|nr:Gfo/Idh/MocA family oxidoreductase [Halococcus sp.]
MTLELAFVGVGGIASVHLERIEATDDAAVVAVCDIDEDRAREVASPWDAAVFTDHERMFAEADFDAVFVCLPPFAHTNQELLAAEHDVDLFVEKPLGLSVEYAREVREAVEEAGIVTQVGHMNRYTDIAERAEELLSDRTVALADGRWFGGLPGAAWWREKASSGGQVVEQAIHIYDLVRGFAGDAEWVSAVGGQTVVTESIDFADSTTASIRHANGTVSHVSASSASPENDVGLTVIGENAYLDLDFDNGVLRGQLDGEEVHHENQVDVRWTDYRGENDAFRKELDDFLDAVRAGDSDQPRSPYADALRSFELTLAVNESLETDTPIEVR